MYSEPLLPDEFRASSWPLVAFLPGVLFSGPVVRGSETFVMPLQSPVLPLRCYRLAYHPPYLAYRGSLLQAYLTDRGSPVYYSVLLTIAISRLLGYY